MQTAVGEHDEYIPYALGVADDGERVQACGPVGVDLNLVDVVDCLSRPLDLDIDCVGIALERARCSADASDRLTSTFSYADSCDDRARLAVADRRRLRR